jgi:hypothetical protein
LRRTIGAKEKTNRRAGDQAQNKPDPAQNTIPWPKAAIANLAEEIQNHKDNSAEKAEYYRKYIVAPD